MRVHITGLKEASHLCVDLHWSNVRDASKGYLASGEAKPVGRKGGSFDFEIMVRATNGLRFVNGIVFLSPTGDWKDHTFVAATDLIPVTSGHDGGEPTLVRWPVRQLIRPHTVANTRATRVLRWMTGLLWLAAAVTAWLTFRSSSNSRETSYREHLWWQALALALVLACGWEMFGLENWVGTQARAWAHAEHVYYERALFQRGFVSVALAATLVFLGFVWRKRRPYQLALLFFGLYLAITLVNLISLHALDQYAGLAWHGITLIGVLKFLCAAATLKGICQAKR